MRDGWPLSDVAGALASDQDSASTECRSLVPASALGFPTWTMAQLRQPVDTPIPCGAFEGSRGQPAEPAELFVLCCPTRPGHVHLIFTRHAQLAFSTILYVLLPSCPTGANESSQSIRLAFQPFTFLFFPLRGSTRTRVAFVLFSFFSRLAWVSLPKRVVFWGIYLLPLVPRARFRCCSCSSLCLSPRTPLPSVATEDQRSPS